MADKNINKINSNNEEKRIRGLQRLQSALLEVDGHILSDYYNSHTPVTVKIYNAILTRTPSSIFVTLSDIVILIEHIKNNNDTLIDIFNCKNNIMLKIKTFDRAVIIKTILAYYKFSKARTKLFNMIKDNNHSLLSAYISEKDKVIIDFNCGHKPNLITPNSYKNGVRCPVCCGQKVEEYVNDIATTHPQLLKYFVNINDAKINSIGSKTYITFKCDTCGNHKPMLALNLLMFGFSCSQCGDGISYPNKFMFNLLQQLNEDFDREIRFDWCLFENYIDSSKSNYGIYDFVIENKKIIIEMDGNIGHGSNVLTMSNISEDEAIYKDLQKDNLALKHGYKIIRIDCKYKNSSLRFDYVKKSILQSTLNSIYDLSMIDWNSIHLQCLESIVNKVCILWNIHRDTRKIIEITKLSNTTVLRYLKEGAIVGLCDYSIEESIKLRSEKIQKTKMKPIRVIYEDNISYHDSTVNFIDYYYNKYQMKLHYESIRQCLVGKKELYKGFTFQYITREEFNKYKQEGRQCYGDFFILSDKNNSKENNLEK